jgi:hypothetical protein
LLKHVIGIALRPIHRQHKLAVLVRSSTGLFDFEEKPLLLIGKTIEPEPAGVGQKKE